MLIKIFKSNNIALGIALPVIAAALWLPSLIHEKEIIFPENAMPFYSLVISVLSGYKIISAIVSILLIIAEALLLNFTIQEFHLLKNQTYLPALLYTVLMCSLPEILFLHPVLFGNLFLLLALKRCLDSSKNSHPFSVAFDSGFFISIGSMFYFPCIIFLFFVFIALLAFRSFSLREWLIAFTGVCVPYLFVSVYYYCFGNLPLFWSGTILQSAVNPALSKMLFTKSFYVFIVFLALILVLSVPAFLSEMARNKASIRSSLTLFVWLIIFSFLSYFLTPSYSLFHFCFASIPLSVIFSNLFLNTKRAVAEIIFTVLVVMIVINLL